MSTQPEMFFRVGVRTESGEKMVGEVLGKDIEDVRQRVLHFTPGAKVVLVDVTPSSINDGWAA